MPNKEIAVNLPKDPIILLSYINTQLRDFFPNLEALCEHLNISPEILSRQLALVDYHYDVKTNQFK